MNPLFVSAELENELIAIRQHLHAHPELSFEEYKTSDFIKKQLEHIGISYQSIGNTGIVALIQGKNPDKKCVALRADMDALPIQEENEVSYKSNNAGLMHACGHDVHSTCLLGAATLLFQSKDNWEGTVKLIFQPGEEQSPGGASILIKEGVLDNPKVACIAGLHVSPELASGTAGFRAGSYMASADEIHLTIKGKTGHAALPHTAIDPIVIAANIISNIHQVIARRNNPLNPSLVSFGKIEGGKTTNVIPSEVKILGTFRTFDETWRAAAKILIRDTCRHICDIYGGDFELEMPAGYPSLSNDPHTTMIAKNSAIEILGADNVVELPMRMSSEDFSFYAAEIPATFFRLGTNKQQEHYMHPVHSAYFDIDESSIKIGAQLMANTALHLLKS